MLLNVQQVSERLGVSRSVVHRMIRDKILIPRNERKPGAKKFYAKFQVSDITEYKKNNGLIKTRPPKIDRMTGFTSVPVTSPATGIITRLTSIEEKLDRLIKMWS